LQENVGSSDELFNEEVALLDDKFDNFASLEELSLNRRES
jgi:hypothetical protein